MSLTGKTKGNSLRGNIKAISTIRGYSAYEIAVLNGFVGTEEEWLASLEANPARIQQYVNEYLKANPTTVDTTLSVSGAAADAYSTRKAINDHATKTDNPHSVTKAQVGLGNVDNTSDADKPVSTAQAKAISKARPYNLLDNSDFTNPVNQGGATSYSNSDASTMTYAVDRWKFIRGTVAINDGYINYTSTKDASYKRILQSMDITLKAGKYYTMAMSARINAVGNFVRLRPCSSTYGTIAGASQLDIANTTDDFKVFIISFTVSNDTENAGFDLLCFNTESDFVNIDIKWAVLYEGEYTSETLPEYQPKGYKVEELNCGVVDDKMTVKTETTATLAVASWSSKAQTVSVSGVTADGTVIVTPAPGSYTAAVNCGVYCSAQGSGTLSFACTTTPTVAITYNILILT